MPPSGTLDDQARATAQPAPAGGAPGPLARRLALAGLLPFVAGALLVWLVRDEAQVYAALGLSAWAALVCSFLGGIHWGLAMREAQPPVAALAWSVVPAMLAWPAVLMPADAGLVVLGVLLVACYAVDRRLYPRAGAAHWLTLRFRLSAVAALACFIGAAGS
jgi:hypothetical protein